MFLVWCLVYTLLLLCVGNTYMQYNAMPDFRLTVYRCLARRPTSLPSFHVTSRVQEKRDTHYWLYSRLPPTTPYTFIGDMHVDMYDASDSPPRPSSAVIRSLSKTIWRRWKGKTSTGRFVVSTGRFVVSLLPYVHN